MKKFISLALALVMALSLTTMAWGADTTLTANTPATANNAVAISGSNCECATALAAGETFNGAGYTYTVTGSDAAKEDVAIYLTGSAVIKNVTIDCAGRGIDTDVSAVTSVVIDNVTILNSERALHIQAPANLDVSNSTFAGKISYVLSGGTATFTNCTFKANSALTVKGNKVEPWSKTVFVNCVFEDGFDVSFDDWNNGSADSGKTMTLTDCFYDGAPLTADNMGDLFTNTTGVDVAAVTTAAVSGSVSATLYDLHKADALGTEVAGDIAYVTVAATKNEATGTGSLEYIKIGTKCYVKIAAADATIADFYVTNANQKAPLFYLAEISDPAAVYYHYVATEFTNIGVKCDQMNVPYTYTTAELDFYVYVNALTGAKTYFVEYDPTFTYTTGAPYFNGGAMGPAGAYQLLVGNEIVVATMINPAAGQTSVLNQHVWAPVAYDKTTPVKAMCGLCNTQATVYKPGKAPAGSLAIPVVFGTTNYELVITAVGSYAPAVTPSTGSTVTSAQTFDAGIAMYVGMSVMAAAGSAVVIGKKKD